MMENGEMHDDLEEFANGKNTQHVEKSRHFQAMQP
jgi:hypothetical protein